MPTLTRLAAAMRTVAAGGDRGSATVQVTLLAPLLVLVLLFVVLCQRLGVAQLDLDTAAHTAARAASLARTLPAAHTGARSAALGSLAAHRLTCHHPTIHADLDGLEPGGTVTVTIGCTVGLSDLTLLAIPGHRRLQSTAVSPIDTWRSDALPATPVPAKGP